MRKIYFLSLLFISTLTFGQATDLYFSMYGEGSSSNKFIEIYNGTGASVDLGNYSVELYSNGATTATNTQTFTAGTMLNSGDVYVLYNGNADATIAAAGDLSSSVCNFNGDDALALLSSGVIIDQFGEIGVDPGSAWDVGSTTGATANHTLVRKVSVCSPNATALDSFGTDDASSEWDVFASDAEWGQIGTHSGCTSSPSLVISSPTDGEVFAPTTTSVDVTLSIANFQVGATTAGLDGHIHYVLTTDGTAGTQVMKYDDTPINLTVASGSDYSLYVELVDNSHTAISPAVNATVTFSVADYTSVADLAALRADYNADPAAGADKYYQVGTSPVITYSRASRNQKYIQDTTAGILIDDNGGIMPYNDGSTTDPVDGDALSGLVGQVSTYGGVLQFVPAQAATIASSGNTITPEVVTIADITANQANYESELVQITGVTFADGDGTNTFAASTNYDITDTTTMVFRTLFSEADYVVNAQVIPSVATDLVALVAQYNGTPQVVARSIADISVLGTNSFNAIEGLSVYPNPIANGAILNITSASNNAMTVQIFDILGKEVSNTAVINNTIEIANLNSGVYIVKISQDGKTATRKLVVK